MADTLATIRDRVAFRIGGRADINSRIDENINEAILQVIQEVKPQEMWATDTFTTTSAKSTYDFSADLSITDAMIVLFVRDNTADVPIYGTSYEVWNRYQRSTSSAKLGNPRRWCRYKNGLILFSRIPDATSRTIEWAYLKRPTRLSADTDTFPLNDEWKRPVEELAAAITLEELNSPKAQAKYALYQSLLDRRMTIEGEEDASPEGSAFIPISNLNMVS